MWRAAQMKLEVGRGDGAKSGGDLVSSAPMTFDVRLGTPYRRVRAAIACGNHLDIFIHDDPNFILWTTVSDICPLRYFIHLYITGWIRTSDLRDMSSALSPLSYGDEIGQGGRCKVRSLETQPINSRVRLTDSPRAPPLSNLRPDYTECRISGVPRRVELVRYDTLQCLMESIVVRERVTALIPPSAVADCETAPCQPVVYHANR